MTRRQVAIVKSAFRESLQLSQREYAAWLQVSRSVLNMYEIGQRSLPTHAHIRHAELQVAQQQLSKGEKQKALPAPADAAACAGLLQRRLQQRQLKLQDLQRQEERADARHKKLHARQHTLQFMTACSEPGCSRQATKWLELTSAVNAHAINCCKPEELFMLQHRIRLLTAEIAATEKALAKLMKGECR